MMRAVLLAALLLSAAVAGCSGQNKDNGDNAAAGLDFDDLDLKATDTTGIIRGVVVDEAVRPLAGATVVVNGDQLRAETNAEGLFAFDGLEAGTYFLAVSKNGYNATQVSAEVVAGVAEPPIVKVLLQTNEAALGYVEVFNFEAFITCGFAVVASSVGCNTFPAIGQDILGDRVYFPLSFTKLPSWIQGELVWKTTQAAGGMAIWQLAGCSDTSTDATGNDYCDGPPSQASPALTFAGQELIADNENDMLENGVQFSIFGGPHPSCNQAGYGCGVTLNQKYQIFIHVFYNHIPPEGWRFTANGEPPQPQ